jgi:hypothetical protein
VKAALAACDFPFEDMRSAIQQKTGRRDYITVEWADLSRYAESAQAQSSEDTHDHTHDHKTGEFDFLAARGRTLGLAWYSLKVSMDLSLENDPRLGAEVFLAEGAHMVDFTVMTDEQREGIWDIYHDGQDHQGDHGHDWFDKGGYRDFVGEAFMAGFTRAYAPSVDVTILFTHESTTERAAAIRRLLTPAIDETAQPTPVPPVEPSPPPAPDRPVFGSSKGKTFHDAHQGVPMDLRWSNYQEAVDAGRRPCKTCKPSAAS